MSEAIKIELSAEAERILRHVTDMPETMLKDIAKGMNRGNALVVAKVQQERLTGIGPFPVAEHRLGVRSDRLRAALRGGDVTLGNGRAESSIGSDVKYAAIHEFGGRIHHEARAGSVRLRTNAQGELLRQAGHRHLAVFASAKHKRAREVVFESGAYDVEMPERAPVRTGIREHLGEYGEMVSAAIQESWDRLEGWK